VHVRATPREPRARRAVSVTFFQDSACSKPCGSGPLTLPSACTSVSSALGSCALSATGAYLSVSGTKVTGGSCAPSTETSTVPPVSWGQRGQSCTPAGKLSTSGCSGGSLCAPATDPGYPAYCIHKPGDHPCSSTGYTNQGHVLRRVHRHPRVQRLHCGDVSPSECGDSSVAAFAGACSIFSTAGYTPLPVSCAPLPASTTDMSYAPVATGGRCTPGGGAPTGAVSPAMAETFCCTP